MLHAGFARLNLTYSASSSRDVNMDEVSEATAAPRRSSGRVKGSKWDQFVVPSLPSSADRKTGKDGGEAERMRSMMHGSKTPQSTPLKSKTRHSASLKSQSTSSKSSVGENLREAARACLEFQERQKMDDSIEREDFSPVGHGRCNLNFSPTPCSSRQNSYQSVELRKLCSGSYSRFPSDSTNSSHLFVNDSFLSSSGFTDDVFQDVDASLEQSMNVELQQQESVHMQNEIEPYSYFENYFREKSEVVTDTGASIVGSPSKIRHKHSRSVRRVKSASCLNLKSARFSPLGVSPRKSCRGKRWYKAATDSRLYDVRRKEAQELETTSHSSILLTKRALRFDDCTGQRQSASPAIKQVHVEEPKCQHQISAVRTETPESGYGSLNSTRQTPDVVTERGGTPLSTLSKSASRPSSLTPSGSLRKAHLHVPWLGKFDLVSRLYDTEPSIVEQIFSYLEPKHLVLFSSVSVHWRRICSSHLRTAAVRDNFLSSQRRAYESSKENLGVSANSERLMTGPGTPLTSVQRLGRPTAASTPNSTPSTFEKFYQVGQRLEKGQSVGKCKCGSPAPIEARTRKASCSNSNCQFEFCIKCRMGFHGNSPCASPSGSRKVRGPSVGSKKSKKNLRRHSRLSVND